MCHFVHAATSLALACCAPTVLAQPTTDASDIPGVDIIDLFRDSVGPIEPLAFQPAGGTVIASFTTTGVNNGIVKDPAIVGRYDDSASFALLPARYGPVDPASNPGDYRGIFQAFEIFTITFDVPVTGAGVTLYSNPSNNQLRTGSIVTAYDGPNGTGSVIASTVSPDTTVGCCPFDVPPPWFFAFFRGIVSPEGLIRSLVIEPTGPVGGWGIDAIAVGSPGAVGCSPGDLASPFGVLDFFDVIAYLDLFSMQDAAADLDDNGVFDFFDVLDYLGFFDAGCD